MRIFIITMDDPIETKEFIKGILDERENSIIGLAVPSGDRLTLSKGKSKNVYILSLLLILGPFNFLKNVRINLLHRIRKIGFRFDICRDPTILGYAKDKGIPIFKIRTPNSQSFRQQLIALRPDVIINQSQSILKKELLNIPSIGVINRHNALLPKNRGRLTPFWVLYRREKETGVSIHFVTEGIDAGDIIVQERIQLDVKESFNSLVKRNYQIAPKAMRKALDLLESGNYCLIKNDDNDATYNSVPTLKDAVIYRIHRFLRFMK